MGDIYKDLAVIAYCSMLHILNRLHSFSRLRRLRTFPRHFTSDTSFETTFASTRLPLSKARSLPGHVHHSKQWYAAELKHLLTPGVPHVQMPGRVQNRFSAGAALAAGALGREKLTQQAGIHRHAPARGQSSSSSTAGGAPVCVTGANGFIALHLVEQLLIAGYRVIAAVRTDNSAKLAPLKAMSSLGELSIVSGCDLLTSGSFEAAMRDAEVCFHTASPFWMDNRITDTWKQLVLPAEQGTKNVLDACEASKVRSVVLTSSFAALMNVGGREPWPMDFEYTEEHWNISSAPDEAGAFPEPVNAHAYRWSKTLAEKAAWEHTAVAEGKINLTTILPPMVLGSNKQVISGLDDLNQSSLILYNLMAGNMEHVMPGSVGFVDVADVAKAHVLAAQTSAAAGQRYLCSGTTNTWLQVVAALRELYPDAPLPTACPDGTTTQPCLHLKNDKIRSELGLDFVPLKETLKAQCESLALAGLLKL